PTVPGWRTWAPPTSRQFLPRPVPRLRRPPAATDPRDSAPSPPPVPRRAAPSPAFDIIVAGACPGLAPPPRARCQAVGPRALDLAATRACRVLLLRPARFAAPAVSRAPLVPTADEARWINLAFAARPRHPRPAIRAHRPCSSLARRPLSSAARSTSVPCREGSDGAHVTPRPRPLALCRIGAAQGPGDTARRLVGESCLHSSISRSSHAAHAAASMNFNHGLLATTQRKYDETRSLWAICLDASGP
ncbi:unnamed protein product, partial [Urochloa humidicola]